MTRGENLSGGSPSGVLGWEECCRGDMEMQSRPRSLVTRWQYREVVMYVYIIWECKKREEEKDGGETLAIA